MYFHTALLQLRASADMFVLVCSLDDYSVTPLMGGAKAMAFSLRRGPWQKLSVRGTVESTNAYFLVGFADSRACMVLKIC